MRRFLLRRGKWWGRRGRGSTTYGASGLELIERVGHDGLCSGGIYALCKGKRRGDSERKE
jgi:hypothetical protein